MTVEDTYYQSTRTTTTIVAVLFHVLRMCTKKDLACARTSGGMVPIVPTMHIYVS